MNAILERMYMNLATGSIDSYEGWWYEDENGCQHNAVDDGEVIEVVQDDDGTWTEVSN